MRALSTAVAVALAAAVLSVGCSQPVAPTGVAQSVVPELSSSTAPSIASAAHPAVPFQGKLEGTYTLTFPAPLTLAIGGEGTGNATQLGQFTFDYDEIVDLLTGVGTGTYEFTAANGDTLSADWTGLGFPTPDPNVILIVENATISGGTGRFSNAKGSFKVERSFNFTTNAGAGSFDGTISLR